MIVKNEFDSEETRRIYELILENSPFSLENKEEEDLKRFIEQFIVPLSISEYLVRIEDLEIKVIIRTTNTIGEVKIKKDSENENRLRYKFTTFSIPHVINIDIGDIQKGNILYNSLWIDFTGTKFMSLWYLPYDQEATNFVKNLLQRIS